MTPDQSYDKDEGGRRAKTVNEMKRRKKQKGDGYARAAATTTGSTLGPDMLRSSSRVAKNLKASHSAGAGAAVAASRNRRG